MFIIKGKKNGILWDTEKNKPLIKFVDGKASTENRNIAEKLQKMGFEVDGLKVETKTDNDKQPTQRKKKE